MMSTVQKTIILLVMSIGLVSSLSKKPLDVNKEATDLLEEEPIVAETLIEDLEEIIGDEINNTSQKIFTQYDQSAGIVEDLMS
ncbi:MAG: hypothetical protein MHMPM18_001178 [Marteilia pararefringens]